jgi:amino acid transporter
MEEPHKLDYATPRKLEPVRSRDYSTTRFIAFSVFAVSCMVIGAMAFGSSALLLGFLICWTAYDGLRSIANENDQERRKELRYFVWILFIVGLVACLIFAAMHPTDIDPPIH